MSYLKFSFTLLMVVVTAFVLIYVVEGYYEARHSAPADVSSQAVEKNRSMVDKVKGLFRQAAVPPGSEPVSFFQKDNHQPEVHHGLCVAAMTGDFEKTKMLLDAGISPNTRDAFGIRGITRATLWGHYEVVKLLLERGANVNEKERLGVTLLMLAANQGDEKLLKLFLDHGAEVNAQSEDGETALTTAARKGHKVILEMLKKAGAKSTEKAQPKKAVKKPKDDEMSSRSIADRLFSRNRESERETAAAPAEAESETPPQPAEPAADFPSADESELVNLPGEAPKALSSDALAWAANVSQASIQENAEPPLEEENAAPRAEIREERPAVLQAVPEAAPKAPDVTPVAAPRKFEDTRVLTPPVREEPLKPVLPMPVPAKPVSPEGVKAKKVDLSAVPTEEEMLEQALLSLNEKRKAAPAPAAQAVVPPPVQTVVQLPEPKPLPPAPVSPVTPPASQPQESQDFFSLKQPPAPPARKNPVPAARPSAARISQELLHACIVGDSNRVRILIDDGANVNTRGALEMTPLMIASQDGNLDVVKVLLLKGADLRAQNVVGQTALRLAMLRERREVIAFLKNHGAPE